MHSSHQTNEVPILICCYGEQNLDCVNFRHWRERFRIIHSISLTILLCHQSSFVSFDSVISSVFAGIDPSASNCLLSFRQFTFLPSIIFVKSSYFLFHCLLPWLSVRNCHSLLYLSDISIVVPQTLDHIFGRNSPHLWEELPSCFWVAAHTW